MSNPTDLKLSKWPFFLANAILLCLAYFIWAHGQSSMGLWESVVFLFCGIAGALLSVTPFLLEYRAAVKMVETGAMVSTISQVQNIEELAEKIGEATSQWQGVQENSSRTLVTAKEITDRISQEAAAFTEFLKKASDSEKNNLRLELDKMRRGEADWLQTVVRLLDHVYALNQAALRSGQQSLIEQLGQFQNSCRDVARRIGIAPFVANASDAFDPKIHQTNDSQAMSIHNPRVQETIATGYTYQGKMIRAALVTLQNPPPAAIQDGPAADEKPAAVKTELPAEEPTLL